jgi:NAD(P)-dependent dehydrogenase (short-subunit alcohol dehydrogenase family)
METDDVAGRFDDRTGSRGRRHVVPHRQTGPALLHSNPIHGRQYSSRNVSGMTRPLDGKVALVTGATRGAGRGTAVSLGEAGATVYCTGRSSGERRSEYDRPETIEETAELVTDAGGTGIAVAVDHLEPDQVGALVQRIDSESGRLDVLVNDIWGGELLAEWNKPVWEHDLENGLRMLRLAIDTHLITSHFALPVLIRKPGGLLVEMTDGTRDYNAEHYRLSTFYDLAKWAVLRLAFAQGEELAPYGCTAVALTPGWLRSEMMLEHYRVTEENWRDGAATNPHFAAISETPRFVGRAVAALAADPDVHRRNGGSFSSGGLAREYGFTDLDGSQPDAWRYIVEVQDAGLPADPTGYR